jgi:hypothetical protein
MFLCISLIPTMSSCIMIIAAIIKPYVSAAYLVRPCDAAACEGLIGGDPFFLHLASGGTQFSVRIIYHFHFGLKCLKSCSGGLNVGQHSERWNVRLGTSLRVGCHEAWIRVHIVRVWLPTALIYYLNPFGIGLQSPWYLQSLLFEM